MSKKISKLTRRDIFDYLKLNHVVWCGRLEETEFLSRIYDLEMLPSYDSRFTDAGGDIWQHRINNYDWDDYWIFGDDRFDLTEGDDNIILRFLTEMLHPVVRSDLKEIHRLQQDLNSILKNDGYEIIEKMKLSGKPVFSARVIDFYKEKLNQKTNSIIKSFNSDYVAQQITIMESSIENSPHMAIGLAKELIETVCKSILNDHNIVYESSWTLLQLMKESSKILKLTPKDIPEEKKGSEIIRQILGNLSAIVHGLAELRNEYGTGHGKDPKFFGLQARHAKLAVGASSTLAIFLLETKNIKKTDSV